eukprot:gb/GECG01005975.1/.p1 GENE.gb/GECG01005975.1/~~gb/GECG01005975.1/.p1  ORF type:complete len:160 (+),score=21.25 gb/GECG01005975.1/:1-480(+)
MSSSNENDQTQASTNKPFRLATWYASLKYGLQGDKETFAQAAKTTPRQPCFRSSLMWGISLGCLIGLHRWKETGRAITVLDWGFGGWFVISCTTWVLCRKQQVESHKQTRQMYGKPDKAPPSVDELWERQKKEFYNRHGFDKKATETKPQQPEALEQRE